MKPSVFGLLFQTAKHIFYLKKGHGPIQVCIKIFWVGYGYVLIESKLVAILYNVVFIIKLETIWTNDV